MKTQHNKILLLLISVITGVFAQGLTIIAIPWYFTEINKSATFSLSYAIITFIGLFWGLYAGVIIDYCNRKKILLYTNFISAFIFLIIGGLHVIFKIYIPFLFVLGFGACSFYYIIFFPNLYAIVQELTNKKDYAFVNSFIEILMQIINIMAAITCGLLLSENNIFSNYLNITFFKHMHWDIGYIFLLNAMLYFSSFLILFNIKYLPKRSITLPFFSNTSKEVKNAFSFLKNHQSILIYGICSQIIFAFLIVELFTLLPLFVKNCLNKDIMVFSLADVVYGFGAIISSFITVYILKYINKIHYSILLITITGYAVLLMITWQNLHVFFLSTLIIGITNSSIRITRMTYFFEKLPSFLMGRINTIFNTINTLIRVILILIFSTNWFAEKENVLIGYQISIYVLILFTIPIIIKELILKSTRN